ncbi:MAG: EAL domain-containing protein [Gammaproteobacteria bacterium]|jgi:EAL domain-containing protein (putative c-di-GMP-specific phosphodiesterase class I)/GGDEF domain-containing protein|nr:EAL domain-containing protein [Gammaproteobacteria bacterium]
MTLSKQLMLLIAMMFLAIFALNFYISINNIKEYLQVESEITAQDTATSLGLSLSPHMYAEDDGILETMVNTIFDRGYYLEILLEGAGGKELVRKTNPKTFEQVPDWFVEWLPMETATARSEISTGWTVAGRVHVTVHPGIGYLKLWQQAQKTLVYSAVALVFFLVVLVFIVRLVLIPLGRIERLALSIADGNFDTIDPLPWTAEIRNVAVSMNLMSGKIEGVIRSLNARLEEVGDRMRLDEVTGLEMRATFETEMKQRFMSDGKGFVFLVRIDELGEFASTHSNAEVDAFIKGFVGAVRKALDDRNLTGDFLYRIVGAEFILLAECQDQAAAVALCERIMEHLGELGDQVGKDNIAHVGGVPFDPQGTTASMVSAATEAYEKARLIGPNSYAINEQGSNAHDLDTWKKLVAEIIDEQRFEVDFTAQAYALAEGETDTLVIEEAMARVEDHDHEPLPIGTFVSVAETIGRIHAFDMAVVRLVLEYIGASNLDHDVAVNLSFASLASNEFRSGLYDLLQQNDRAAQHLVFSVTAYGATRDLAAFRSFIDFAHRNGAKVILKRFEPRFIPMDDINKYHLDYIRLARVFTEGLGSNAEKRRLVEALKQLGELLDIHVVAEGVLDDDDYRVVREIGLTAASR